MVSIRIFPVGGAPLNSSETPSKVMLDHIDPLPTRARNVPETGRGGMLVNYGEKMAAG
jgi:hypothetical protein